VFVADEGSFAMPFMVICRTSDGSSRFEQSEAIDEAARFVERLRNSEGIDQIRIYRMEEIGFAFRPYYKVELGLPDRNRSEDSAEDHRSAAAPLTSRQPEADDVPPPPPPSVEVVEVDATLPDREEVSEPDTASEPMPSDPNETAGANGRRGLFGR
jgi:hypothetical protein